jgi:hypothetical protein
MVENLSLQIASGILIAVAIVALARFAIASARAGDWGMAFPAGLFVALIGGGLVLAGFGSVPW